ncbi:hypothetical protein O2W14_15850 [Modestobacter sp. VKM Ac-2986]|uniref:hypothetical protein n=1 Tax=Modestobacter sp. VKM Ac-2986 TaxID=3004140 RepID=UPI0022ABC2D4|nr:hypothetical protein [Modestobacter sp. VKM Ac-2986]MCZ2830310.1 hypothetical protein [Modestobacter sp. VKM Ac-2986]
MSQPPAAPQHAGEPGNPGEQPPYGQPPYGPPAWGPPQYAPQYGPPQSWPPYPAPPPNRTGLLWGLVAALATVVLVLTVLLVVRPASGPGPLSLPPVPVPAPAATLPPTGLGADADLDRLAQQCSDGQMNPCDDLYQESFPGSDYEAYGDTCAGRRTAGEDTSCADVFYDS